jgi:hypothetical protein
MLKKDRIQRSSVRLLLMWMRNDVFIGVIFNRMPAINNDEESKSRMKITNSEPLLGRNRKRTMNMPVVSPCAIGV